MTPCRLTYRPNISEELALLYSWIGVKMEAANSSETYMYIYIYILFTTIFRYAAVTTIPLSQFLKQSWSERYSLQTFPPLLLNLKRSPALKKYSIQITYRLNLFSIYVGWIYGQKLFTCNKTFLHKLTVALLITKRSTLTSLQPIFPSRINANHIVTPYLL